MEKNSLFFKFFSLYYGGFGAKIQHKNLLNIKHMVAAGIVMGAAAVISILTFIPHIGQSRHRAGLFPVKLFQEAGVNRFAVGTHPATVEIQGAGQ